MEVVFDMDELEYLEGEFSAEYIGKIDEFDSALIDYFKRGCYHEFLSTYKKAKEFCYSHGSGGVAYFKNYWGDDPRLARVKQSIELQGKRQESPNIEDVRQEILAYFEEKQIVFAKDIYIDFQYYPHSIVQKVVSGLSRKKIIRQVENEGGPKKYYLV